MANIDTLISQAVQKVKDLGSDLSSQVTNFVSPQAVQQRQQSIRNFAQTTQAMPGQIANQFTSYLNNAAPPVNMALKNYLGGIKTGAQNDFNDFVSGKRFNDIFNNPKTNASLSGLQTGLNETIFQLTPANDHTTQLNNPDYKKGYDLGSIGGLAIDPMQGLGMVGLMGSMKVGKYGLKEVPAIEKAIIKETPSLENVAIKELPELENYVSKNTPLVVRAAAQKILDTFVERVKNPLPWEAENASKIAKEEALTRLKSLTSYADDLSRLGYTQKEIEKIGVNEGRSILQKQLPQFYSKEAGNAARLAEAQSNPNLLQKARNMFYPLESLPPDLKTAFIEHNNGLNTAALEGNNIYKAFKTTLKPDLEWKLVQYSQNPGTALAKILKLSPEDIKAGESILAKSKLFNDELYQKAITGGFKLNYLENHIYQLFNESPEKIQQVLSKGASKVPGFTKQRLIKNFMTGLDLGLTPKFTSFAALNAAAQEAYYKALTNKKLTETLSKSGKLLPESDAPAWWRTVTAPFFPKIEVRIGREVSRLESYKAPPEIADFIDNYFGRATESLASKSFGLTGGLAQKAQDVVLSSPGLTVNSFTIGQLFKDLATGVGDLATLNVKRSGTLLSASPKAVLRGLADIPMYVIGKQGLSERFEASKAEVIKEMAQNGIKYSGLTNYKDDFNVVTDGIGKNVGGLWNKLINEPTFSKFLWQRKVDLYQGFRDTLIKGGMAKQDAIKLAVEQLNNYDGVTVKLGRSRDIDNILKTFFLAPTYREAVLGSGANIIKGLVDFKNPAYSPSRSLLLGLIATYVTYDALNVNNTGRHMFQNPSGKEFELMFDDPKNPGSYYSFPWMPSSTAIYRRLGSGLLALLKGDLPEAGKQLSSLFSIPISIGGQLYSGTDYFGRDIFPNGNPSTLDYATAAGKGLLPAPVNTATKYLDAKTAGKPTNGAVTLAQMFEIPIKQGKYPVAYFTVKNELDKNLTTQQKQIVDYLNLSVKNGGPSSEGKADILLKNSFAFDYYKQLRLASNPNDPLFSRKDEDIKAYLAYQLSDNDYVKQQIMIKYPFIPSVQVAIAQSIPGVTATASPKQQLNERQVQIVSLYSALPSGSVQRKQLLATNPWLKSYWDANTAYYNANPINETGPVADLISQLGISSNKPQISHAKTPSTPKMKKVKVAKTKTVKLKKPPKLKVLKAKTFKVPKLKNPKLQIS